MVLTTLRAPFIGRTKELEEIGEMLAGTRLLTLMGAGGVGKTRLALEAAERLADRYPDGVFVCELASLTGPEQVPAAVKAAFGLRPEASEEALQDLLANSTALLVVDNCEHVREAAASAVAHLIRVAPRLSVLVTSRERLHLEAETAWILPPLTAEDGLALLAMRATARAPRFRIGAENRAALEGICARLDGIPLAIELAAARLAILAPEEVARLLDDALTLLTGGEGAPRHRTMREALEWSARLLEPQARNSLEQLSVFPAGFKLAGAAAVLDTPAAAVVDRLSTLVDASFLVAEPAPAHAQFRLLEPVRQFAADALTGARRAQAMRRHADYTVSVSEWIGQNVFGVRRQTEALEAFERHLADIRQAVEWSLDHEPAWAARIMASTGFVWEVTYRVREGSELLRRCAPHAGSALDRTRVLTRLGSLIDRNLEDDAELPVFRQALEAAREAGNPHELGLALAFTANTTPQDDESLALIAEAIEIVDREGDRLGGLFVHYLNAQIYGKLGTAAESRAELEKTRTIALDLGEDFLGSQTSASLISGCLAQGDNSAARKYLRAALKVAGDHPDWATTGALVYMSAALAARTGRPEAAVRLVGAIKRWRRETGLPVYEHHRMSKYYDALAIARTALPASKVENALRAGEAMNRAEAIALARELIEERPVHPDDRLTKRELEVVQLVASGHSNKEIAARLRLSVRTIEGHVERVLNKLDLQSRAQVVKWAAERDLLGV